MNARERFNTTMHYQPRDRPYSWEFGAYERTLERWRDEGLSAERDMGHRVMGGYDHRQVMEVQVGLWPPFRRWSKDTPEGQLIEDIFAKKRKGGIPTETYLDASGNIVEQFPDHSRKSAYPSMPHVIYHGLRTRDAWETFYKPRLDPYAEGRFPPGWPLDLAPILNNRDYPLGLMCGSIYGYLRNWMGLEGLSYALHDDPAWVEEMAETITACIFHCINKQADALMEGVFEAEGSSGDLEQVKPWKDTYTFEFAAFWEDMACKHGSLIDPKMYERVFGKYYETLTSAVALAGIDIISVDSDGDVSELLPIWLDWGWNCVWPMEQAAGNDVVEYRRKYGKDLRMMGGMDKRVLARGDKAEIQAMVERVTPLIQEGGYVPTVDHGIPHDVSLESFLFYRRLLSEVR
jgi:uroporphyrinogen decarboxylase